MFTASFIPSPPPSPIPTQPVAASALVYGNLNKPVAYLALSPQTHPCVCYAVCRERNENDRPDGVGLHSVYRINPKT